jgi:hypothetical protein
MSIMHQRPIYIAIQHHHHHHHHHQMFLEEDWDIETLTAMILEVEDIGMPMAPPTEGETNGPIYSLHRKPIVMLHVRQHDDNMLYLEPIPSRRRCYETTAVAPVRMPTIDVLPPP